MTRQLNFIFQFLPNPRSIIHGIPGGEKIILGLFPRFDTEAATSWFMYAYAAEDPLSDLDVSFLNNRHGAKPTYVIHKSQHRQHAHSGADSAADLPADLKTWDLRNLEVRRVNHVIIIIIIIESPLDENFN